MRSKTIPMDELWFAAKMGFLSKSIWLEHFSKRSYSASNSMWRQFMKGPYLAPHNSKRLKDILVLGKEGKKLLEKSGVEIVPPPNLNQIEHDETVARIALTLKKSELILSLNSEGELKRRYMGWMKKTKEGREAKMPDLLIDLKQPNGSIKIAIEVELSRKNPERYRKVMDSYASQRTAKQIVFISDHQNIFDRLAQAMKDTQYPSKDKPIGFSYLKDWKNDPWTAVIYFSNYKTNLHAISLQATDNAA